MESPTQKIYVLSETNSSYIHFLRAISSQLVLIGHALSINWVIRKSSVMSDIPSFCVLIFFVLSGFVIAYSAANKGKSYGFKFYFIDRFARIYITLVPALLLTLVIGLVYFAIYGAFPFDLNTGHFITNLTMQQDNVLLLKALQALPNKHYFYSIDMFGENIPLWSLSIEWWHYVFFGLVFYLSFSQYKFWNYVLLFFSSLFVVGYMLYLGRASYGLSFIWFSGVLAYHLLSRGLEIKKSGALSIVFLLLMLISLAIHSPVSVVVFLCFFATSVSYFNTTENKFLNGAFKLFKWPGNYSFSLYIIHYPILLVALKLVKNPIMNCVVVFIISNIVALFFYLLFESKHKVLAKKLKAMFK